MKHLFTVIALMAITTLSAQELVFQDAEGVIRYTHDRSEVAVFGANYCLPSASDYRAADKVAPTLEEKKRMIDIDMAHFARMGFRALRLSFWGDWENSDKAGNLLDNEHLDLLDYLIYRASERGILMLFSPTVAHAAWWPDGDRNLPGFSAHYPKHTLNFDPDAIRAQQNYMTQFLNYRNRYTGKLYKEEPHIIAVEILNEPPRILDRNEEIRAYIDTMTDAIRATGCQKIVAYNISENFFMAPALNASKAQCATYGWYPTQLNHGETLRGNYLPYVNDYTPMKTVDIGPRSKMVYEFDAPDLVCSYMYPAQVREFREGGVQWAAMFSYDMIGTAPWNLGWQTHLLNMVYTPRKAVSAMIAVRAMQALPRGKDWGNYPANNVFGPVTVDWKADRSTYYDGETLLYTNSLPEDFALDAKRLQQIAGVGSSAVVESPANRIYFLDRVTKGQWIVELYPAVQQVDDPYKWPQLDRRVFTLDEGAHHFAVRLPGV
ncbi:MAG: cellulase family glycosylhydrolase, partial [Alistipes sp.]|nr:cellulase family glycosylhydrolase [Alistipes sp.]